MKRAVIFASALLVFSTGLYAQSALIGKYSGTLKAPDNRNTDRGWEIVIKITSAENGKLAGTILSNPSSTYCLGSRSAGGTYDGNRVKLAVLEEGAIQGCGKLIFEGVAEGNKLIGKIPFNGAPREITLSK